MKRILMYGIVCLVLLQVVIAAPALTSRTSNGPTPAAGGTAAASATTVDIGGGYHLPESVLTTALTGAQCSGTATTNCWSSAGNQLKIYDNTGTETNRDDPQHWQAGFGVNE